MERKAFRTIVDEYKKYEKEFEIITYEDTIEYSDEIVIIED